MGMYDELICEMPLPDGITHTDGFQTKSLDNVLDKYTITAEGELWCEAYQWDWGENRNPEPERILHHGWLNFYTFIGEPYGPEKSKERLKVWLEYDAKFTDGKCVELKVDPNSDTAKESIADVEARIEEVGRLYAAT